ncbi:MAG: PadR family transcriptional regulator [Aigarchaeota archaeon]|nr:PadR family transcriptional regulator [Aigarchaeota archaeon]MCX8193450.1 PadR family transcriptional regulator [Nitrososphaeria archaeon]MDW7985818.1 PadR family transcriptional regulator [Nitrososphaerota archaeon]
MKYRESKAVRRFIRKITVENLWMYILSLLKEEPIYGYEIRDKIFKKFNFKPGKITCYVVLYKLEKEGLISSKEIYEKSKGAPRRYYVITDKGLKELEKAKKFLKVILSSI